MSDNIDRYDLECGPSACTFELKLYEKKAESAQPVGKTTRPEVAPEVEEPAEKENKDSETRAPALALKKLNNN